MSARTRIAAPALAVGFAGAPGAALAQSDKVPGTGSRRRTISGSTWRPEA